MQKQQEYSRALSKILGLEMWIFLFVFMISMIFSLDIQAADSVPSIIKAQLINNQDIELYWSEEVTDAGWVESKNVNGSLVMQEQNYSVTVDGIENPIYYYCFADQGNYEYKGVVYYNTRNSHYPQNPDSPKTTIRLTNPIENLNNLPEIKVTIKGDKMKSSSGVSVPEQTITISTYQPFYQKQITLDCGVKILGTAKVKEEAMTTAEAMLKILLANPEIANRMGDAGCMLGIYGDGEIAYDIPEHRFEYDEAYLYVEGFGGTQLASIRDANVLRLKTGDYKTGYPDESILTHEFAHTIHSFGLSQAQQQQISTIYQEAIAAGKWPNSYAGSNEYEYFATLSAIWFNVMDDTYDGNWDGVRGPINTRAELKVYDRAAYDFLSTVYVSDQYLPSPWENGTVPDNTTYPGTEPDPKPTPEPEPVDPQPKFYTVKFIYNNGKKDRTEKVEEGKKVKTPQAPKRKNYIFKGWYLENKKYSFSNSVKKDITLQAKWKKVTVKTASFSSLKAQKGKKVLVKIKKLKDVEGYKVIYAKNAKFSKGLKSKYIKSVKLTIKNLKKGTYYFKVQAYCKDSTDSKVLGKASKVKKVTVKR